MTITEGHNVVIPIKPGQMKRAGSKSATRTQRDAYKSPFVSIHSYNNTSLNSFFFQTINVVRTTFSVLIDFDFEPTSLMILSKF